MGCGSSHSVPPSSLHRAPSSQVESGHLPSILAEREAKAKSRFIAALAQAKQVQHRQLLEKLDVCMKELREQIKSNSTPITPLEQQQHNACCMPWFVAKYQ